MWCLVTSLTTHYGFLAAFFWMNVIAFDLFRNFRSSSSHLLLTSMSSKARLPSYAIYGWLGPLVIVLIAITIDLTVKLPYHELALKPCYAGYLDGCKEAYDLPIQRVDLDQAPNSTATVLAINNSSATNHTAGLLVKCYPTSLKVNRLMVLSATCWIKNGNANLIFFGAPVGAIIAANAVFYFLTVYNIRKKKSRQQKNDMRRFSRIKLPGDEDVKFYIQMAIIMGFTWITGFFLMSFPTDLVDIKLTILYQILIYVFILSNASIGVFIFFAFIFKKSVKSLYTNLVHRLVKRTTCNPATTRVLNQNTSSTKSSTSSTSTTRSILRNSSTSSSNRSIATRSVDAPRVRWSESSGNENANDFQI